jgi:ABC-type molybdenum transport system ATPase subunit/photorepair protein PhrA
MGKYEIWGADDSGKTTVLAFVTGATPHAGDTVLVRGQVRVVERVWRHHVGPQATQRIAVGAPLDDPA